MSAPALVGALSADEVRAALRRKYPRERYALFEEVRDAAGFSARRSCDAMALALWPSDGLMLHGFEIKASRSDWLRELKDPAKADQFIACSDFWWLVAGARGIVKAEELPAGWGLLEPRGGELHASIKPQRNAAVIPIDRGMMASLFRRAQEASPAEATVRTQVDVALREQRARIEASEKRAQTELADLRRVVSEFEKASGMRIGQWSVGNIGEAVAAVMRGNPRRLREDLRRTANTLRQTVADLDRAGAELEATDASVAKEGAA